MKVWIVAFAKNGIVFFVGPIRSEQTVRRIEGRSSTYFHLLLLQLRLHAGSKEFETMRCSLVDYF